MKDPMKVFKDFPGLCAAQILTNLLRQEDKTSCLKDLEDFQI